MPELPEVETVKRTLETLVVSKVIKEVEVSWPKMIKKPDDVIQFQQRLQGQRIEAVERRAKFLKFVLSEDVLVSHLRMEGRYGLFEQGEESNKHTHVVFRFTDGTELRYQDVRKFGTMHLFHKGEEDSSLPLSQLGLEPFANEFTADFLEKILKKTNRKIKVVLLDQKYVVGLGNIYVDEALFQAKIHPETKANELKKKQIVALRDAIVNTLEQAVNLGGSSIKSYVNGQGEMGMFQQQLLVYGRKGEHCTRCGTEIEKTVVGGRGTHFCPKCQK
ncbi:DNA-formamidopyrimidine glycosylase [Bacillus sp. FJAT-45350]|uniref:DNA-formamidopyrimidine glycosylase n=1 Tax=Bacillus sp. FJAT-45350 TaxID=2011014 RepID=UPI000BB81714|nr:DNA-formamidopyrimidine glycosylase [Bacillus sp. FJAT-45350]